MFTQLWREEFGYVGDVLEDNNDRVDSVVLRSVVVVGVGQVLEQSQKVSDALHLVCYLRVILLFHAGHNWRQ